jgi:hypothetical protein
MGTTLVNDRAARPYAVRVISKLIDGGGYDDRMIVKDAAERQVFAIPFSDVKAVR